MDVGLLQHPQHLARDLSEQPGRQQRRRGAVFDLTAGARELVQGAQRQTAGRQCRIDRGIAERHDLLPAARRDPTLEARYLGLEGCKNCDVVCWLHRPVRLTRRTYGERGGRGRGNQSHTGHGRREAFRFKSLECFAKVLYSVARRHRFGKNHFLSSADWFGGSPGAHHVPQKVCCTRSSGVGGAA